jgi:adenylate cyclase
MSPKGTKRKLTAILSADVKGYSHLMEDDEVDTIRTLTAYREVMTALIQKHSGRVVDAPGDNLLSEFASAVVAVNCAAEIQRELAERNAKIPETRKMEFRIGVNVGDVVEEGERIYGDGVNIAARVEGLAEGGGICISGTVYDQVKNKLGLEYEFLGEKSVKNISEPIRVYRVMVFLGATLRRGIEPASVEKMAFPLPDKPSIAVLPFDNMSGDPKEEYFSDGVTEQIITSLSKFQRLFVIARKSTFVYKGKPVTIQKVAEDLGVRYVMEGSFQKSGERVRITAQLIDALTGYHIWSEHYDRGVKDIFALQDEITINIMNAVSTELIEGELAGAPRLTRAGTDNLKALEKHYQGVAVFCSGGTKEANDKARQLFEEAIAFDPKFPWPYVWLGLTYYFDARFGWSESPAKSLHRAFELAQKALAMDDLNDSAHSLLANIYLVKRQHHKALAEAERAVALNPNGADLYAVLAGIIGCAGKWEESVSFAKKAIRLSPFPGVFYYFNLGRAYYMAAQYDESIATWEKALQINPDFLIAHVFLAACYSSLGRDADATAAVKQVFRINTKFTIESYAKTLPYRDKADIDREVAALRKAGLK